jgi:hypothetical protein
MHVAIWLTLGVLIPSYPGRLCLSLKVVLMQKIQEIDESFISISFFVQRKEVVLHVKMLKQLFPNEVC